MCSDESVSFLGIVSPCGWERLHITVITSKSVDSAFNENQSELGVLVTSAFLQVLSDVHSLLDQMIKVFWDLGGEADFLQDSEDFAAGDALHLWNTNSVSKSDTDLRWRVAFLGELNNGVNDVVGGYIDP